MPLPLGRDLKGNASWQRKDRSRRLLWPEFVAALKSELQAAASSVSTSLVAA
jgi:hypothetical protein